ncbi:MAG TPA: fibronectin type III domain-containing protein, partial [Rariglobus sp.]|nr:fibronectin type III domain-containing protein [Rariglobus sp.]
TWTDNATNETGFTIQSYNGSTWSTYATVAANATTYTRTGLNMPSGPYTLRVIATGSAGNSAPSNQVTLSIPAPPAGPAGLTATPGTGQIALSWNAVSGASNYNISRATASAGPYSVIKYNQAGTTYANTGTTAGTTYYYKVCYNVSGSGSSNYAGPASATSN